MIGAMCLVIPVFATGCATTYDAYGNPQQTVDPGVAVAGVVAAGLIGYAIADNNNDNYYRRGYGGGHYGGHYGGHGRHNGRHRGHGRR